MTNRFLSSRKMIDQPVKVMRPQRSSASSGKTNPRRCISWRGFKDLCDSDLLKNVKISDVENCGSHSGQYGGHCHLGYEAVFSGKPLLTSG
jgi:hypothetical protein